MRDGLTSIEPLDSDTSPRRGLSPVLLVGSGGALGTAARYLLSAVIPDVSGVPLGVLIINLTGAFLLGFVLEGLALRGPDKGVRRSLRLFLGTGVIGGFTTYSTLATGAVLLIHDGHLFTGIGYSLGTVILGAGCSLLGIIAGHFIPSKQRSDA